jgi:outer membrane murein-binding lipoprotein Lpp
MNEWIGLVTAAILLVNTYLTRRNGQKADQVGTAVSEVHDAVNNTAQEQNARVEQLSASLTEAGAPVPPRPPIADPPEKT